MRRNEEARYCLEDFNRRRNCYRKNGLVCYVPALGLTSSSSLPPSLLPPLPVRCGPCKLISPVFEALSEEISTNEAVFLKVDVDVNEVRKEGGRKGGREGQAGGMKGG